MPKRTWSPSLTTWIFVGLAVGILVGWASGPLKEQFGIDVAALVRPLSLLFLNLIKSIIAPLVFSTLVIGIAHTGDIKQVGRMGLKSLLYFEVVTTVALAVGLVAVNLARPGVGVSLSASAAGDAKNKAELTAEALEQARGGHATDAALLLARVRDAPEPPAKPQGLGEIVQHLAPASIIEAMAKGDVLQIVVFSSSSPWGRRSWGTGPSRCSGGWKRWPRSCLSSPRSS